MKSTTNRVIRTLWSVLTCLSLFGCSSSEKSSVSNSQNTEDISANDLNEYQNMDVISSNNIHEINRQINEALAAGNFSFAFDVVNSIPSHFGSESSFCYNNETGEIGGGYDSKNGFTTIYRCIQYCRKAVSVLKAESDVLLSKNDPEADILFLEHLADFDLGVNHKELGRNNMDIYINETYRDAVNTYNEYLISVIRKALLKNRLELAEKISFLIRDGLSCKKTPKEDGYGNDYNWFYNTEAKDEAKEIIRNFNKN